VTTSPRWPRPQELLRRHGLWAKRSWSQNFLVDPEVPHRIAELLSAEQDDVVVELGAGLGHLTAALAATGAQVVAVERDRDLVPVLRAELGMDNVTIAEDNALTYDLAGLARETGRRLLLAGNLPYHLTGPLLGRLLSSAAHISRFAVMVQREVAERLVAPPGSRTYGALSVRLALWSDARIALRVPAGSFHPVPKVDSAVVAGALAEQPKFEVGTVEKFDQVARAAFSQRRKTIANSLKALLGDETRELLMEANIDAGVRAEQIEPAAFARLSTAWSRREVT